MTVEQKLEEAIADIEAVNLSPGIYSIKGDFGGLVYAPGQGVLWYTPYIPLQFFKSNRE